MAKMDSASEDIRSTVKSAVVPNLSAIPEKKPPLYLSIRSRLEEKVKNQMLPKGTIIKEGPLAAVFGVSRAPVRRALKMLEKAGVIKPARGQGFIVGDESPGEILSSQDLQSIFQVQASSEIARSAAWENIYQSVHLDVTNCLPFGTFQVSETIACEHFSVGRTALRETLGKLQNQGLLEKSNWSHWIAGPLTARDVHEGFEVRHLLEPEAFMQSVVSVSKNSLYAMHKKVKAVIANLEGSTPEDIEDVENDLHKVLLENTKNRRVMEAIERNQMPFIVNRIFRRNFGLRTDLAMLQDQAEILDQLIRNRIEVARSILVAHLTKAEKNTLAKLRVLSTLPKPAAAPYLINVH